MKSTPSPNPTGEHEARIQGPSGPLPRTSPGPTRRCGDSGQKRILLVDDDALVRESLSDLLKLDGYDVIPAADGRQAVNLANNCPVDLVLLDLNMPVLNGWDTFEQLTKDHPLVPVIIVTGRPNQLFMAVNAGAGALMEKPMDVPILLGTICKLLAESAEERIARLAGKEADFHYKPSCQGLAFTRPKV